MENLFDVFALEAMDYFGTEATHEYYRRLREERRLCATKCAACGALAWPPREFCPACHAGSMAWVEIGEGATLYAFTTQRRSLRFAKPDVIGLVDLPGLGRILTRIGAPLDALRIGMAMRFEPIDVNEKLVLHQFVPVG
ncbi:MAG: OB-fold domain-containing protein [Myxococcales bacterium]|nr:OB-fold domain-containing protein [Myxococcales bacterium]